MKSCKKQFITPNPQLAMDAFMDDYTKALRVFKYNFLGWLYYVIPIKIDLDAFKKDLTPKYSRIEIFFSKQKL